MYFKATAQRRTWTLERSQASSQKEKDRKKGAEIIANTILAVPYCIYSLGAWVQSFVPFRIQGLRLENFQHSKQGFKVQGFR